MTINVEARLTKLARDSGFIIRKQKLGGYIFAVDTESAAGLSLTPEARSALGGGTEKFCPTLQDVAKVMQRLHILGR